MKIRAMTAFCGTAALIAGVAAAENDAIAKAVAATPPEEAPEAAPGDPASVFAFDEMDFTDTDVGARVQLMDGPTRTLDVLEIHITTLNPGEASHPPHRHPNEEVVVLQEGTLEAYVNGETKLLTPGSVMVFFSMDWHSVNNVGDTPATYQVINFHP